MLAPWSLTSQPLEPRERDLLFKPPRILLWQPKQMKTDGHMENYFTDSTTRI